MERDAADTTAAEMRVRSRDHDSSPAPGLLLATRTRGVLHDCASTPYWPSQVPSPSLRFHTPLIEPDVQISRIRLSDRTSRLHPRRAASKLCEAYETKVPVQVREWINLTPASPRFMLAAQPPA